MEEKKENLDEDGLEDLAVRTIASYNILHPYYAASYNELPGVVKGTKQSNWNIDRKDAIRDSVLMGSYLDIYMLQEVGLQEMRDLMDRKDLASSYAHVHSLHQPDRSDGVAILWKRKKYERIYHSCLYHLNGKVSIFVKLRDRLLDKTLFVFSLHLDWRGGESMAQQLQEVTNCIKDLNTTTTPSSEASTTAEECLGVILGGDFNYSYGRPGWDHQDTMIRKAGLGLLNPKDRKATCEMNKLDWLFWKPGGGGEGGDKEGMEEEVGHRWAVAAVERSRRIVESSGYPPSDHTLVSTTFRVKE